jgi:uncharacterized membrane protein YcaP (DUF421 family)
MEEAATHSFDLYRIFIGDQPLTFLVEILFRTAVMYLYVLLVLRLLGKRGMGQLSPFEFTIIIALGSAVGDPMFYPEVPLLHCLAVVTVVVAMTRFVTYLSNRSEAVEDFLEGQPCSIVTDGELDIKAIDGERFSREELFMLLRERNVSQLGQVRQAYLEPSGAISTFRAQDDQCKPGLPIIPPFDEWTPAQEFAVTGAAREPGALYACWKCGHVEKGNSPDSSAQCARCDGEHWTLAQADPFESGCHRQSK